MAHSLQRSKMKEENPNPCKALITTARDQKVPPTSPLSYFISITIPQPKIRIKIPKLLAKTMQRRSSRGSYNAADDDDLNKNKKIPVNPGKLFQKKVGLIFSNVFGSKRSDQEITCSSSGGNNEFRRNGDGFSDLEDENEAQILNGGNQPVSDAPESTLSKSNSMREIWDTEEGKHMGLQDQENCSQQSNISNKPPLKVSQLSVYLSSFFSKKRGLKLNFKRKTNKSNSGNCREDINNVNGVATSYSVIKRQESAGNLIRVPAKILTTRPNLRRLRSIQKKMAKRVDGRSEDEEEEGNDGEREDEGGNEELCKKRILMGEKCKPLNSSGNLHYDKDGILLPEVLPW